MILSIDSVLVLCENYLLLKFVTNTCCNYYASYHDDDDDDNDDDEIVQVQHTLLFLPIDR